MRGDNLSAGADNLMEAARLYNAGFYACRTGFLRRQYDFVSVVVCGGLRLMVMPFRLMVVGIVVVAGA